MKTGNEFSRVLNESQAIADTLHDPRSAVIIERLIKITKTLDRNQKALIQLVLRLQRENKYLSKIEKRMYAMMNRGQKNIVDVWLEGDVE